MSRRAVLIAAVLVAVGWRINAATAQPDWAFTNFETEPVRPLVLAADGRHVYALNTADDRLEILAVTPSGLERRGEIAVGLRPVALTETAAGEVWVVNHLSDSVSVVDVTNTTAPKVLRTLVVGDEPRDIVVGGTDRSRVFVATAHRDDWDVAGAGRGAVWVFDAGQPQSPPEIVPLAGMKPRALAVSHDGREVYAAVFHSGNGTTIVPESLVRRRVAPPPTPMNTSGEPAPSAGLIVRQQSGRWLDDSGRDWTTSVPYAVADEDVFVIDTTSPAYAVVHRHRGVGTTLFNMTVQPGTGALWVTNTEAHNHIRFEPNLKGRALDNRVTRIDDREAPPRPISLNSHIRYDTTAGSPEEITASLAQPTDIVFTRDGRRAYVAAFGSRKVGVLDQDGEVVDRIDVGFGPSGLALDETHDRLYVLNHLEATISIVSLATRTTVDTLALRFDPTGDIVHAGRPFLYDAALTSGHGDMSCAACHVFADLDGLAWDLGDPGGEVDRIPFALTHENFVLKPRDFKLHPMKGPMTTQSFRGLVDTGPLHWRGDRFGTTVPGDSLESFRKFNPAFVSLNGRAEELELEEMDAFGRFLFTIRYPPNPYQALDRSYTLTQERGFEIFTGPDLIDSGVANCENCHRLPLGTNGLINFEGNSIPQDFKAPHLRNVYQKVGFFPSAPGQPRPALPLATGFGLTHDGAVGTLDEFLQLDVFDFPGDAATQRQMRSELAAYIMAFDTGMAPAVGRQVTLAGPANPEEQLLLNTLVARAGEGDCDLVARVVVSHQERGWLFDDGLFRPDALADPARPLAELVAVASPASPVTFTCVPPGDGRRSALDRDGDGYLNADEIAAGSDPADPKSYPGAAVTPTPTPSPTARTPTGAHVIWLPSLDG